MNNKKCTQLGGFYRSDNPAEGEWRENWFVSHSPVLFLRWNQNGYQRYGTTEGLIHSFMLFGIALWIIPSRFNVFSKVSHE